MRACSLTTINALSVKQACCKLQRGHRPKSRFARKQRYCTHAYHRAVSFSPLNECLNQNAWHGGVVRYFLQIPDTGLLADVHGWVEDEPFEEDGLLFHGLL
jgi:hypothetical protein